MRVVWFPLALDDLEHARAYIAEESSRSAEVVAGRILNAVETLVDFPDRGRSGRVSGTRELVVPRTPFIVAYRTHGSTIEILRVIHGARRWPSL
jgi:toxin ParE1/3/4